MTYTLHHGDCLDVLRTMPDNSVDAIVTDPPYGLSNTAPDKVADTIVRWASGDRDHVPEGRGFMGRPWDAFVPPPAVWDECLRVLKPGGHMLVFAGSRTQDLMGLSIRLAGFDIRDGIGWIYGSGFPKSMDVSKAIDKRGGNAHLAKEIGKAIQKARESRGLTKKDCDERFCGGTTNWSWFEGRPAGINPPSVEVFNAIVKEWPELGVYAEKVAEVEREVVGKYGSGLHTGASGVGGHGEGGDITAPATPEAERWSGWGTALKPAIEPVIMARKPLTGTVAANVSEWGTGALNIDASRVPGQAQPFGNGTARTAGIMGSSTPRGGWEPAEGQGRFPANVLLDPEAAAAMDEQSGVTGSNFSKRKNARKTEGVYGEYAGDEPTRTGPSDAGGASRFFPVFKYQAKAPKRERPVIERPDGTKVQHPTVKPLALMSWLVTLVTPPGGVVLDPFAGSGTTLQAARDKGFHGIGIEADLDHCDLIRKRLDDDGLLAA